MLFSGFRWWHLGIALTGLLFGSNVRAAGLAGLLEQIQQRLPADTMVWRMSVVAGQVQFQGSSEPPTALVSALSTVAQLRSVRIESSPADSGGQNFLLRADWNAGVHAGLSPAAAGHEEFNAVVDALKAFLRSASNSPAACMLISSQQSNPPSAPLAAQFRVRCGQKLDSVLPLLRHLEQSSAQLQIDALHVYGAFPSTASHIDVRVEVSAAALP